MSYKWCVVPQCKNTSLRNPEKVFVSVPTNAKRRNKWLQLARRDPTSISSHTNVFMCEDHFDMEKDSINYMKYKMGFSKKILLTDDAMPKKFHCQEDRKRRFCDPEHSRDVIAKRRRMDLIQECEKEICLPTENSTMSTFEEDINMPQDTITPDEDNELQEEDPLGDFPASVKAELSPASFESSPSIQCVEASEDAATAGYRCDRCRGDIVGFRYCCVECANYDLCGACEAGGHHAAHYVLRVPSTKPHLEVQAVLENIRNSLFQKEDDNRCDLEVKVEVPEPAPEPDPLAAPRTGGLEDQNPATIESTFVLSNKTEDLEDAEVKLELMDEESQETPHSRLVPAGTPPTVPPKRKKGLVDVKVYNSGGGGFTVYTQPAPAPTPRLVPRCSQGVDARKEILLNKGMLVERTVKKNVPSTTKRKTKAPSLRQAKVKKVI